MKSIEEVRIRLNRAISIGCSEDHILTISKLLDDLIVEQMMILNRKYIMRDLSGRNITLAQTQN